MEREELEEKKEKQERSEKQRYQRKSAGYVWWLTIVIILLLVAFFGLGYALGSTNIANDVIGKFDKSMGNDTEKDNTKQKLEVTTETKQKLEKFIKVATDQKEYNSAKYEVRDYFEKGVTGLTKKIKLEMTNLSLFENQKVEKNVLLTAEEVEKLIGSKPNIAIKETVYRAKAADFISTYKELFKEDLDLNFDDLAGVGCPRLISIDNTKENIYYSSNCGGSTAGSWGDNIDSYDSDNEYYYVHQTLTNTSNGAQETKKLVWKFDKDLKFVSTAVE